jgi:hypothetical protein
MSVYLVLDGDGTVVNAIEWDGIEPYTPFDGEQLVPYDVDIGHWIGWSFTSNQWHPPASSS